MQKITLVTGGSKGIGAAIAKKLAHTGHTVVINYRNSEADARSLQTEIASGGGKAFVIQADISSAEDADRMFRTIATEVGVLTGVVHCASGSPVPKPFKDLSWEDFQMHGDVQLKGAFNCIQRCLPSMLEQSSGAFLFISSIFTHGIPPQQQSPYIVAKAGLEAMARTLAVEVGPKNIRVNVIAPGMTHTEMISTIPEKVKMVAKMNTPLRRLAEPEDIAETAAFLMGDGARHITGEIVKVCGGLVM